MNNGDGEKLGANDGTEIRECGVDDSCPPFSTFRLLSRLPYPFSSSFPVARVTACVDVVIPGEAEGKEVECWRERHLVKLLERLQSTAFVLVALSLPAFLQPFPNTPRIIQIRIRTRGFQRRATSQSLGSLSHRSKTEEGRGLQGHNVAGNG